MNEKADPTSEQIAEAALALANEMLGLFAGKPTSSVIAALSMHLGLIESLSETPNLDGLMRAVRHGAECELNRQRAGRMQ